MKTYIEIKTDGLKPEYKIIHLFDNLTVNHNGYNKNVWISKIFNNGKVTLKYRLLQKTRVIQVEPNSDGVTIIDIRN